MNESASDSGAVHVYRLSGGSYALERFLKAPNNRYNNKFGNSVGVWGTTIVVGAPGESDCNSLPSFPGGSFGSTFSCSNSGGVYIFQGSVLANWHWTNFFKPTFNWSSNPAGIGTSIAISGSTVVSGAIGEASAGSGVLNGPLADSTTTAAVAPSGAVYVFDVYSNFAPVPILGPVPPVAL